MMKHEPISKRWKMVNLDLIHVVGDTDAIKLWQEFRDLSIEKYKEMYHRLNIAFDIYSGESQYSYNEMKAVLDELKDLNLLKMSQGAEILDMNEFGLGAAVIAKSDGSMLYLSRDIAAAIERQEKFKFDKMFYVVANQQFHHFKQLFKILELMGKHWSSKCQHIDFGMIKGMSTRKGNVVFLQEILDHTQEEMHQVMKSNADKYAKIENPDQVADCVAISSIMIQDMSARRSKDYEFDWSRMLSFEGDTGPYLQYAHARLCSMERTANITIDLNAIDYSLLVEPQARALVDWIARYPLIVNEVSVNLEPCTVVTYLYELAHRISAAWEVLWVMGREPDVAHARMAVYKSARITLGNALALLGLR
jgi:arginyl-tRNA synthetase